MALYIKASLCYMLVLCFRGINIYKNWGCVKAAKLVQTGKSIWSGVFFTINSFQFVSILLHQYYESYFQGYITPVKVSGWNISESWLILGMPLQLVILFGGSVFGNQLLVVQGNIVLMCSRFSAAIQNFALGIKQLKDTDLSTITLLSLIRYINIHFLK